MKAKVRYDSAFGIGGAKIHGENFWWIDLVEKSNGQVLSKTST